VQDSEKRMDDFKSSMKNIDTLMLENLTVVALESCEKGQILTEHRCGKYTNK